MTIKQSLGWAKEQLAYACERPLYEAEILMMFHLGSDRVYLTLHDHQTLADIDGFQAIVARRVAHEPMEYITKSVSFYDIELFIDSGALIPRPETEILIDRASAIIEEYAVERIVEIGVGSGAISVVLARKFPHLSIVSSDISTEALSIARRNVESFGLESQIELRHTSLLDGIEGQIDMVISNPPYIAMNTPLAPNVAEYEPHTALYSGSNGDELLKSIITLTKQRGIPHLACEMGYDQRERMQLFADEIGVHDIEFYKDYADLDRGFTIKNIGEKI